MSDRPRNTMSLDRRPPLPSALAFVIKLHRDCRPGSGLWFGRLEHLASGRQGEFASGADLWACLARIADVQSVEAPSSACLPLTTTPGDLS